jgi:hypothetical protein
MENVTGRPIEIETGPILPPIPNVTSRHAEPDELECDVPLEVPTNCAFASGSEHTRRSPVVINPSRTHFLRNISDCSFRTGKAISLGTSTEKFPRRATPAVFGTLSSRAHPCDRLQIGEKKHRDGTPQSDSLFTSLG